MMKMMGRKLSPGKGESENKWEHGEDDYEDDEADDFGREKNKKEVISRQEYFEMERFRLIAGIVGRGWVPQHV